MTLEIFRAVTPFITLLIVFGLGIIGWLIKRLIGENSIHFKNLKTTIDEKSIEMGKRLDKVEQDIENLEVSRQADQKYIYEQFVSKESFFLTVGRTERSISRIFKHINELSKMVNQNIGVVKARGAGGRAS